MLHRIEAKIVSIEDTLSTFDELESDCDEKFLTDKIYHGALLHYLYLAEMVMKYINIPKSNPQLLETLLRWDFHQNKNPEIYIARISISRFG